MLISQECIPADHCQIKGNDRPCLCPKWWKFADCFSAGISHTYQALHLQRLEVAKAGLAGHHQQLHRLPLPNLLEAAGAKHANVTASCIKGLGCICIASGMHTVDSFPPI